MSIKCFDNSQAYLIHKSIIQIHKMVLVDNDKRYA